MILIPRQRTHHESDGTRTVTALDTSWHEVRSVRNDELTKSDWRAVKDRTLYADWRDYREFLRDLPSSYETPNEAADALNSYEKPEDWE